jgi:hypothetical protein
MTQQDKKRRHLGSALNTLFKADVVALPHRGDARNKHRGFLLKREGGARADANVLYTVPRRSDESFVVPATLFTHGWINVLSDGELAFLLMSAYLTRNGTHEGYQVPGYTRLLHMGVGPETYEAHRLLSVFGLVAIGHQPGRRPDGTVPNIGGGRPNPMPDTVSYLPEGFDESALHTVTRVIDRMLAEDRRSQIR